MFHTRHGTSSRSATLVLAALAAASSLFASIPAHAAPDECYFVADKGDYPGDRDLLARADLQRGGSGPVGETQIGFTGSIDVEALAADPRDPNFELWAIDHDRLGKIDKTTAVFTPVSANHLGSGNGALGTKSFSNADGLAFDGSTNPSTLYASIRDEEEPDLLIQVNTSTGSHVPGAFGGSDYVVIQTVEGRQNTDALEFDGGRLLATTNERGGSDTHLVEINKATGAVTEIGATGQTPDPVLGPPDDMEGFTTGPSGGWIMNGKALPGADHQSYVWEINIATGETTNPRLIGNGARDWEGFVCRQGVVGDSFVFGTKFEDRNGNGLRDTGEPGLSGWQIHLIPPGGSNEVDTHTTTDANGDYFFIVSPGVEYTVCETLQTSWDQTAPNAATAYPTFTSAGDCSAHTHSGTIVPGASGYTVMIPPPGGIASGLDFGNRMLPHCVSEPAVSKNARAFGLRADLLGGGLILGDPDIAATPDSDVTNPGQLLSVPNVLDPMSPPLVSLLRVSEEETPNSTTATATTAAVDLNIPGLSALRVQADAVVAKSTSYLEKTPGGVNVGASSSSEGSTIANLRIGGVQYGDVSEPLTVVINDPLNPGTPFIEVHVLERVRRGAAAGIVQTGPTSTSGLDVNGIHVVVHDLALTAGLNESSDIIVAHAETDIAFTRITTCPSVSGRAYAAQLFNVTPNLANAMVGEVVLPSTGGTDAEHLADVDVGTVLVADASSTSTSGSITSIVPDAAQASSRAVITDANVGSGLVTAKLIEATANAECSSSVGDPVDCSVSSVSGDTIIADVDVLGTDVCSTLGLGTTCHPAPNTVFLDLPGVIKVVLNEQIPDADGRGLTVNAIHIWVLGAAGPPLPVGAEVIISSAHADTHPRNA